MSMAETPPTLREIYGLIEKVETKLMAEIQSVEAMVDAKLTKHQSVHDMHNQLHETEYAKKSSLIRWAVTSILSGIGVLIAIYLAVKGG